jgi:hypothetical protein
MGAFWGILFQVAVVPVQWAMAKGVTGEKVVTYQMIVEAAHYEIEDAEAQRLNPEDVDGSSDPGMRLNSMDRLVTGPTSSLAGGT